jgi:hypothetical protein
MISQLWAKHYVDIPPSQILRPKEQILKYSINVNRKFCETKVLRKFFFDILQTRELHNFSQKLECGRCVFEAAVDFNVPKKFHLILAIPNLSEGVRVPQWDSDLTPKILI